MGGTEAIRWLPIATGGQGDSLTEFLLNGAVLRGRIAAEGSLLNLVVAGQRIPLPKNFSLPPGTAVEVRLVQENGVPQLRIQATGSAPQAAAASPQTNVTSGTPTPAALAVPLPPLLSALLTPAQAAALLPKMAAIPHKALEALLTVFVSRSDVGRALARLASLLDAGVAAGQLEEESAVPLRAALDALDAESPEEFRRAVEIARETVGARADRAVSVSAPGDAAPASRGLIDELGRVREQLAARGGRPGEGHASGEIAKALDGATAQLKSAGLPNLRALDTPYQFFAIPFSPRTGIEHAQVHMLGADGRRSGGGAGRQVHVVAIDLHLTNLGALWITLQSAGASCSCVIRSEHDAVRRAIDDGSRTLEAGLRRAGFAAAQVRTEAWDGDRAEAAASLLSQPVSFEAEA